MEAYLELVLEYSLNGRIADKYFVDQVLEIAIKNRKFKDKNVEGIILQSEKNSRKNMMGKYIYFSKNIKLYEDRIIENTKNKFKIFNVDGVDLIEYALYYNFNFLQIILHEIEHVYQHELFFSEDKSIEKSIVDICMEDDLELLDENISLSSISKQIRAYMMYKKYYEYCPTERLAQLKSSLQMFDILELAFAKEEIDFDVLEKIHDANSVTFSSNRFRGYGLIKENIYLGPTYTYFTKSGNSKKLKKIDVYSDDILTFYGNAAAKYKIDERILFGLPVAEKEKEQLYVTTTKIGPNRLKRMSKILHNK